MNIRKRILALLTAVTLTILCLPVVSAATVDISVDGATLTLDNSIGVQFLVQASKLSTYTSSFMRFTFDVNHDGTPDVRDVEPTTKTIGGTSYRVYYFEGIRPDDMGTPVNGQLFATKGGVTYEAGTLSYAVTDYINNKKGTERGILDPLMADVLAYGKAAEAYTGSASIVNTANISALLAKASTTVMASTADSNKMVTVFPSGVTGMTAAMSFRTVGVNLRDNAALVYVFAPAAGKTATDYSLKIEAAGHATQLIPVTEAMKEGDSYVYRYRELSATEADVTVRATFVNGNGDPVSAYLEYSVESYAYNCYKNRATNATLNTLMQTLLRYGKAINVYHDLASPASTRIVNGTNYTLTFYDEFEGSSLNSSKWACCPESQRQGGACTWKDSMVSVSDGCLNLGAGLDSNNNPICGAVRTMTKSYSVKWSQCKGYFECRARLQSAPGFWGAFWLMSSQNMGNSNNNNSAADGAEIDIMESFSVAQGGINHAIHWDGYGDNHKSNAKSVYKKSAYDGNFHIFALQWTDTEYIFFIDGVETYRVGNADVANIICQVPLYLKLTVEFGSWAGSYTASTLPDAVLIDYVRVWQAS